MFTRPQDKWLRYARGSGCICAFAVSAHFARPYLNPPGPQLKVEPEGASMGVGMAPYPQKKTHPFHHQVQTIQIFLCDATLLTALGLDVAPQGGNRELEPSNQILDQPLQSSVCCSVPTIGGSYGSLTLIYLHGPRSTRHQSRFEALVILAWPPNRSIDTQGPPLPDFTADSTHTGFSWFSGFAFLQAEAAAPSLQRGTGNGGMKHQCES